MARRLGYDRNPDPERELVQSRLADGTIVFQKSNGLLHREKAPAKISPDGLMEYFYNGQRHRDDGPAVLYVGSNFDFVPEYWLNEIRFSSVEAYKGAGGKIIEQKPYNSPENKKIKM